ncbi:hypothetical protein ABZ468_37365 [Streptomyces sp. NPDC005708]|uniref:zinc finger domain-containing protein n=1 Tax=unclassified Streptomyces TaxID=2593676 RepID=UPI0033DF717D
MSRSRRRTRPRHASSPTSSTRWRPFWTPRRPRPTRWAASPGTSSGCRKPLLWAPGARAVRLPPG